MRITGTDLALASTHDWVRTQERSTSIRAWVDSPAATVAPRSSGLAGLLTSTTGAGVAGAAETAATDEPEETDPKLRALIELVERLLGKKIRRFTLDDLRRAGGTGDGHHGRGDGANAARGQGRGDGGREGWGVDATTKTVTKEAETTAFAAAGTVTTADGRTIKIDLDLVMSREHVSESSTRVLAGDARRMKDPLVLDLGGGPARLVEGTATFDLDNDGTAETMPLLADGAAYLALDRNGNGAIDNGSELFGPASGNGFAELAMLDDDGNGWIDEGDLAFGSLLLWRPDADGGSVLGGAAAAGVGAIATVAVSTQFGQANAAGALLGATRETSIWLSEAGEVRTIQHLDVVA